MRIGIDPSVALKDYLTAVKTGKNLRQNNMIKSLNIDYSGPIDGHDILAVIKELRRLQKIKARNSSRDNYKRKRD
jgi:1-deoxy-D-xylulose-5-phosphate synthase